MAMQAEWRRLFRAVSPGEVQRAKNMLKTMLLGQCDGTTAVCEDIGRQMLTYGRRIPLAEVDARIEAIDASVLKRVVGEYVYDRDPVIIGLGEYSVLFYGCNAPKTNLPSETEFMDRAESLSPIHELRLRGSLCRRPGGGDPHLLTKLALCPRDLYPFTLFSLGLIVLALELNNHS